MSRRNSSTSAGARSLKARSGMGFHPCRSAIPAPEEFAKVAARYDVSDADVNKITHENAMRWYHFDPFAHRSREQCTVSALRAEVAGHDVSIKAMDQGRHAGKSTMSLGELAESATA